MKILRYLAKRIKDARGAATSLVEAGLTIGIGATLVGAALSGGLDAGTAASVGVAKEQAQQIAQAVVDFASDLKVFPVYRDGNATGPNDFFYTALVSENGTYPADTTLTWDIPALGTGYVNDARKRFGHVVEFDVHDSIEGQLNQDILGGDVNNNPYPRKGSFPADPNMGHALSYIKNDKLTADPWSHKYLINVSDLHSGHLLSLKSVDLTVFTGDVLAALTAIKATTDPMPKVAVMVISAGPNGAIETPMEQLGTSFKVNGDDIATRLR